MLVEPALKFGPVHLTGKAPAKAKLRTFFPSGPSSVIVTEPRFSASWLWKNHLSSASSCVTPRLSTRFGYLSRPRSLCSKRFSPPSGYVWTSYSTDRPVHSENLPISASSIVSLKRSSPTGSGVLLGGEVPRWLGFLFAAAAMLEASEMPRETSASTPAGRDGNCGKLVPPR